MQRIVDFLSSQTTWRRWGIAFLAGALSMLALAPVYFWPVLLLTFPVLVWQLDGCYFDQNRKPQLSFASLRSAAAVGWAFGFGFFLTGLYWIGFAFLVEANVFAWLLPFAVTLMPAGLALFFAMAAMIAGLMWRPGVARLVALAIAFAVAEWLRGHILTGFPWNAPGYALAAPGALMQWASVFGVYGLNLLAVLIFSSPAALWSPGVGAPEFELRRCAYPALMAAVLAGAYLWGYWRLEKASVDYVDGVKLRIVQPNIPQKEKWKPENRGAIFERYMAVSRRGAPREQIDGVTHLIWPESALPFLLEDTPDALNAISAMMPDGSVLITGAARAGRNETMSGGGRSVPIFNSLFVMDHHANLISFYDKAHLVPFGEYLPFQSTLESIGLEQLTRVRGGFTAGTGARLTSVPNAPPFIALICYEIIFPDAIRDGDEEPGWLLNLTNDAWFGDTAGPHQHFHQARVRAVEQGLPMVRAANTGISAVTDPYGRIVAELPRNIAQVIDTPLPHAAPHTVFVRFGGSVFALLLLISLATWWGLTFRQ
ncbi:MAG: apolipoprotein N-acyltransferase [Hyphomicrobiaceae bacterium]|nr:apolipoprotein N-acyltransferase [Hyphomicrobiaceae bacterium]